MAQSVSITYILGRNSKTALIKTFTATLEAAVNFATAIDAYTNANVASVTMTQGAAVGTAVGTGDFQSVDLYALLLFRDAAGDLVKLALPAPILEQYEDTSQGHRLLPEHGDAIATLLGSLRGETLTYVRGYIVGQSSSL